MHIEAHTRRTSAVPLDPEHQLTPVKAPKQRTTQFCVPRSNKRTTEASCPHHRPQLPRIPAQHQLRVLFRQPKRNERFRNQRLARFINQDVCEGAGLVCEGGLLEQSGPPACAHDNAVGGGVWLDVEQARGAVVLAESGEGNRAVAVLQAGRQRSVVSCLQVDDDAAGDKSGGRRQVGQCRVSFAPGE